MKSVAAVTVCCLTAWVGGVAVSGALVDAAALSISGCPACRYTLDDGTGQVDLLFLGRVMVAGLEVGRRCAAEGAVAERDGRTVIWNPRYQLLPADTDI